MSDNMENIIERWGARLAAMPTRTPKEETGVDRYQQHLRIDGSGMPKRHRLTTPSPAQGWSEAYAKLEPLIDQGCLVLCCGKRGRGKTQLGCELMKKAAETMTVHYTTLFSLSQKFKATWDDRTKTEASVMADYRRHRFLVIDEVGKVPQGDWLMGILFELCDQRYRDMTSTLLISNHDRAALATELGASIADRANETGGVIDASSWEGQR